MVLVYLLLPWEQEQEYLGAGMFPFGLRGTGGVEGMALDNFDCGYNRKERNWRQGVIFGFRDWHE